MQTADSLKLDIMLQRLAELINKVESLEGLVKNQGARVKRKSLAQLARDEGICYMTAKKKYRDRIIKGSSPLYVDLE